MEKDDRYTQETIIFYLIMLILFIDIFKITTFSQLLKVTLHLFVNIDFLGRGESVQYVI